MNLYLDIETLPCSDPDVIAELTADIQHPVSMKKLETIRHWEEQERPAAVAAKIAKTSLDGAYGRICIVGWAIDDDEPHALVSSDERTLLIDFFHGITPIASADISRLQNVITWVGHNIAGFDLPFIRKRCYVHGIKPPSELGRMIRARPWDDRIADTMLMWDADREKRISLDRLCRVLGIPSPKVVGIDGSKVAELFNDGEYEHLGEYCCADVEATRRCYKAMTFA